jgi:hypothetical protein
MIMPAAALKKKHVEAAAVVAAADPREALTSAILAAFGAKVAVEKKQQAIGRSRVGIDEAEARLETAHKAIAAAKQRDAQRAAASISAGRSVMSAASTERAEAAIVEAEHLVEISTAARDALGAELRALEDDRADRASEIEVAIRELIKPLVGQLIEQLRADRRAVAIRFRVLDELLTDDPRVAPVFHDPMRDSRAAAKRAAVLGALKIEASAPLFGPVTADHEAGLQASKDVKAALAGLRVSSVAPLPKV